MPERSNVTSLFYFRRFFQKEQSTTGSSNNELGPVSFENRLYDDLHAFDKVNLPNSRATVEQSHYATPSAGAADVSTSLGEYASPLPPPPTLNEYADIAAAKAFYPSAAGVGGGDAGVYEDPGDITSKKTPHEWVQFNEDEKKAPITDFVTPQYDHSYPPSYRSSPPSSIQAVSLADLKYMENEVVLPDVYGDLESDTTTPRLSSSMNSNAEIQNNNVSEVSPSKQINVTQNLDSSEA